MRAKRTAEPVNVVREGDAIRMVCLYCGRMSGRRSRAGLGELPVGWSMAPYPDDFQHGYDPAPGSQFFCPEHSGERSIGLRPRQLVTA